MFIWEFFSSIGVLGIMQLFGRTTWSCYSILTIISLENQYLVWTDFNLIVITISFFLISTRNTQIRSTIGYILLERYLLFVWMNSIVCFIKNQFQNMIYYYFK